MAMNTLGTAIDELARADAYRFLDDYPRAVDIDRLVKRVRCSGLSPTRLSISETLSSSSSPLACPWITSGSPTMSRTVAL